MKPSLHDPLRLRDDPGVSSRLRDDLARAASASTGYDVEAGLARFEAALGAGGGAGSPPDPGSAGAPGDSMASAAAEAAKPISGAIAKGILWGVVTVGVASVVSFLVERSSPADRGPDAARGPAAIATQVAAAPAVASVDVPAMGAAPPASAAPPAAKVASITSAARALPPSAPIEASPGARSSDAAEPPVAMAETGMPPAQPIAPPAASSALSLTPEMQHLSRLRVLDASDPAQALAAAAEGDRLFPSGLFATEREAIAISALARLGRRAEARARAEAFITAHPRSHFVERIRRLTGAGEPR